MKHVFLFVCLAGGSLACQTECEALCQELVLTCGVEAYPSLASCEEGCLYEEDQGANTTEFLSCVERADCDTFRILECQNDFGQGS
jgi:hypothetical protein